MTGRFVTGPPPPPGSAGPLRVEAVHGRTFGSSGPYTPHDVDYFTDLLAMYGSAPDAELIDTGRTTFREMVRGLLPDLRHLASGFDVAILAHVAPDAEPGWPGPALVEAVNGAGITFALSELGPTVSFAAVELVLGELYPAPRGRALVWLLDQAAVQHRACVPEGLRVDRSRAVVVSFSRDGAVGGSTAAHAVCPDRDAAAEWLEASLHAAAQGESGLTVVCPPALLGLVCGLPSVGEVILGPAGQPCTGPWSAFLDHLPDWRRAGRRVALADYDQALGYAGLCVVDVAPLPVTSGGVP